MEAKRADTLIGAVKERFKDFLKGRKLADVSKTTHCHYTVVHNLSKGKYTPSLETVFNFKLGYGDEFDEVYILTGKKISAEGIPSELVQRVTDPEDKTYREQLLTVQGKLEEKDVQIRELKQDKEFLQGLVKHQNTLTA